MGNGIHAQILHGFPNTTLVKLSFFASLRLLVVAFLESGFGLVFCIAGIVCSTWVAVNLGTSKRSILVPGGDPNSVATRKGNRQIGRTGL